MPDLYPASFEMNTCGHYSVGNGRHRICIMGHKKKMMKVIIGSSPYKCIYCDSRSIKENIVKKGIKGTINLYMINRNKSVTYV